MLLYYVNHIKKNFWKERKIFYEKINDGVDIKKACDESALNLKISRELDKYMIVGVDGAAFRIYESKNVFPLTQITFEGTTFPCPKNSRYYLKILYGHDYLQIPKIVQMHDRTNWFRTDDEITSVFEEFFERMEKVNENFK